MTEKGLAPIQVYAVVICLIINVLDGFDLLAIAFTANEIAIEWGIGPEALGVLFSSSLVGMILGAFALAPAADTIGRRPQIVFCLFVIAFGMLASGVASSVTQLMLFRFVTGVGIGGILPSINTMVAEYSNARWRNLSLSFMHIGYPLGVLIGGASAAYLIDSHGWRSVFLLGGFLTFSVGIVVLLFLPESLVFLLSKQPKNALVKANRLLVKLRRPILEMLPETESANGRPKRFSLFFSRQYLLPSSLLWLAFFMCMMTQYFLLSWLPKVLIDAGMSTNEGISAGVVMSIGGMTGMLVLGFVTTRFELVKTVQIYFAAAIIMMIAFGFLGLNLNALLVVTFFIGFFLYGALIALYMIGAWLYPPDIRNSGVGWAIGIGRFGAVLGPYLAGILIGTGVERWQYFSLFALPLLVCVFTVGAMKINTSEVSEG